MEAVSGYYGLQGSHRKKDRYSPDKDRTRTKGGSCIGPGGSNWHSVDGRSPADSGSSSSIAGGDGVPPAPIDELREGRRSLRVSTEEV